jgi:hypothetical protein
LNQFLFVCCSHTCISQLLINRGFLFHFIHFFLVGLFSVLLEWKMLAPPLPNQEIMKMSPAFNNNGSNIVAVVVPPNAIPGRSVITAVEPGSGRTFHAAVPLGVVVGDTFMVSLPPAQSSSMPIGYGAAVVPSHHYQHQQQHKQRPVRVHAVEVHDQYDGLVFCALYTCVGCVLCKLCCWI